MEFRQDGWAPRLAWSIEMDRKIVIPLHALLETRDTPTVMVDRDYRIVAANRAYCESYGVTNESVVGRTCHEVSHHSPVPCHRNGEECPYREVFEHERASVVLHTHHDFDDGHDYVRIHAHPLRDMEGRVYLMESLQRLAARPSRDAGGWRLAGRSPAFVRFFSALASGAKAGITLWLHGERGTGRERAARFVHENTHRKGRFVVYDCAAHDANRCEAELFGLAHPARAAGPGVFEQAIRGTLYLDEFDALPPSLQGKLLRVLDGNPMQTGDVRLIVATRIDLARLVREGRFREDLYYRVAGFRIDVPALRERAGDMPIFAESMLARIEQETGLACELSRPALDALAVYPFPGNFPELHALLLGAATRAEGGVIERDDIDFPRLATQGETPHGEPEKRRGRKPAVEADTAGSLIADVADPAAEAQAIRELLRRYGSRRIVAKKLGISVPVLYNRLKQLGIINLGLTGLSVAALFQSPLSPFCA